MTPSKVPRYGSRKSGLTASAKQTRFIFRDLLDQELYLTVFDFREIYLTISLERTKSKSDYANSTRGFIALIT